MSNLHRRGRLALRIASLEDRVTPAFAVDDTAAVLTFTGDDAADTLVVTATATEVRYQVNGGPVVALTNARPNTLERVVVTAAGGNDRIDLSGLGETMTRLTGTDVAAGAGDDTVLGTRADDTIDGGAGADQLGGGSGDDLFRAMDFEPDVLDGGLGRDSAYFESTDAGPVSVEVWNPYTPAPDNQRQKVRVMVLNYLPLVPSRGNRPLYEVLGWTDPAVTVAAYEEAFERASGGFLDFEITGWKNINRFPYREDGGLSDPDEYVTWWENGQPTEPPSALVDYPRMMAENDVPALVDAGIVDEVWPTGAPFTGGGFETAMAGPGAFWINWDPYPQIPSRRPFVMGGGGGSERFVDVLMHGTGHRAESIMERFYGGWNHYLPVTNWDKFAASAFRSNGTAGVGDIHFPANGTAHYDYDNPATVQSFADDFLDYPEFTGATRPVDRESWGRLGGTEFYPGDDYQHDYLQWFYTRFPRAPEVNADGRQNNWWKYVFDFNNYNQDGTPMPFRGWGIASNRYALGGGDHIFQVAYSSAVPIDVSSIDSADVRVLGPNGLDLPTELLAVSDPSDGTYRVGTYRVAAPGGTWDAGEIGAYRLMVQGGQVLDALGTALAAQVVGGFAVRVDQPRPLPVTPETTLRLPFEGDLTGSAGEVPTAAVGTGIGPGYIGDGLDIGAGGYVQYAVADNLDETRGTIQLSVLPTRTASETTGAYVLFEVGTPGSNGMRLRFRPMGPFRLLEFEMWGDDPDTPAVESGVSRYIAHVVNDNVWGPGKWRSIALTWGDEPDQMQFYLDGSFFNLDFQTSPRVTLPAGADLTLGAAAGGGQPALAVFDEVRVSDRAFPPLDIQLDYSQWIKYTGLAVSPTPVTLDRGGHAQLVASATVWFGTYDVATHVPWTTSNPAVATVDERGRVRGLAAGTATITARLGDLTATSDVTVTDPGRPTAALQPVPAVLGPTGDLYLTVVYDGTADIDATTFGSSDVRVFNQNGFSRHAAFVSADPPGNGHPRTATYRIAPPSGEWRDEDLGTYTVEVSDWQVGDTAGKYVLGTELGQFDLRIATPPPTDIGLSGTTVAENSPAGTEVAVLTATDGSAVDSFTFTLLNSAGGRFQIVGDRLQTAVPLDHEAAASYQVVVQVTDGDGNQYQEVVTVQVTNVDEAPTGVGPPTLTVAENVALGTVVGDLLATDPDGGSTFTFELVAGPGGDDNGAFRIVDGKLVTAAPIDYEEPSSFAVRVRATESGGLATEAALTITVADENPERPAIDNRPTIVLPAVRVNAKDPAGTAVATLVANADDDDAPAAVGVAITGTTGKGTWQFSPNGTAWTAVAPVTSASALLVDGSWQVRFVPARGFNGFAGLTYTAWDGQTGTAGTRVDPGATPIGFSADAEKAWVAVGRTVPKIDAAGRPLLNPVREDAKGGAGNPIKTILGLLARELGVVTPLGIAVTGASPTGGTWQYSITAGRKWENVGTVGDTAGLLLRPTDRLRFVPAPDFDGEATITYRTWNLFGAPGGRVPVTGTGFSPTTETATADVRPVNDRPVLDLSRAAVVGPVAAGGASTPVPFGSLMSATDVDNTAIGVAVVKAAGPGTWHYRPAGGSATVLPPVSSGKAILLAADTEVWFEAADDTPAGTAALSFRAWDGSNRQPAGSRVPIAGTSFSKQVEVLTAAVGNTRPTLNNLIVPEPKFTDVIAGAKPGAGDLVRTLLGTAVTDTDTDPGIALTFADSTNGTWWYSLGGNRWVPVGAVGLGAALLLPGTARLRFVPAAGFTGVATIEYRAWDRTAGIALDRIDTDGGLDSFSTAIETATVTVV